MPPEFVLLPAALFRLLRGYHLLQPLQTWVFIRMPASVFPLRAACSHWRLSFLYVFPDPYLHPTLPSWASDSRHVPAGYFCVDVPSGPELNMSETVQLLLLSHRPAPSTPCLIPGYDTTIGFVAQPRSLQSLPLLHPKSSLPPIHAPHLCKNELSKLQIYHFTLPCPSPCPPSIPSPFFFQTFKSFSGSPTPQDEISKFLGCSELCFLPDSIKFLDFSLISGIG